MLLLTLRAKRMPHTGHCVKIHAFWVKARKQDISNRKSYNSGRDDEIEVHFEDTSIWCVLPINNCANLVKAKTGIRAKTSNFVRVPKGIHPWNDIMPIQIRHKMIISRNRRCNVVKLTFWDILPGYLIDSIRPQKKYWGHSSPRWDQKLHILRTLYTTFWILFSCNQTNGL